MALSHAPPQTPQSAPIARGGSLPFVQRALFNTLKTVLNLTGGTPTPNINAMLPMMRSTGSFPAEPFARCAIPSACPMSILDEKNAAPRLHFPTL